MKNTLSIVSHTHWDREWYQTFQGFRHRLVRLVDRLLKVLDTTPAFRHFSLDGQAIVLEDYLEVRPENRRKLAKYIRNGRIVVGPWYILPDEFLVSGESFVRNLIFGDRVSRGFGRPMKVGYLPDQFGHTAAVPKLLKGAGIEWAVVWRGVGNNVPKSEFVWEGDDGTRVLGQHLVDSYGNCGWLPPDPEKTLEHLLKVGSSLGRRATTPRLLIMNGVDHQEAQGWLPATLRRLGRRLPYRWEFTTLEKHLSAVRRALRPARLRVHRGEFRAYERAQLLPSVLSTRSYLKRASDRLEVILPSLAEPLSVFAALEGAKYPDNALRLAWKLLLQNHPHDSICGCSIDAVHREMMTRFESAEELAGDAIMDAGLYLALRTPAGADSTVVFNPSAGERTEAVDTEVPGRGRTSVLVRNIPPFGFAVVRPAGEGEHCSDISASGRSVENAFFRVEANSDGTVGIIDRATRTRFPNCLGVEDGGDAGDEYNYDPPRRDTIVRRPSAVRIAPPVAAGARVTLGISRTFRLPASLAPDRKSRSSTRRASTLDVRVSLAAAVPRVEFDVTVDNANEDHRMRLLFPMPFRIALSRAFNHFGTVERIPGPPREKGAFEVPLATYPNLGFVQLRRGGYSACIANEGLREYEVLANRTLAMTLIRCVGWLSRGDMRYRRGHAGPGLATPEAQMRGRWTYRLSFSAGAGFAPVEQAMLFRNPVLAVTRTAKGVYGEAGMSALNPLLERFAYADTAERTLPSRTSRMRVLPREVQLAALKRAEDGRGIIARFFSLADGPVEAVVEFPRGLKTAAPVNLLERPVAGTGMSRKGNEIRFRMPPNGVRTFRLKF